MILLDINSYKMRVHERRRQTTTIEKDLIDSSRWRENRRDQENALFAPQIDPAGMFNDDKVLGWLDNGRRFQEKSPLAFR
jgi:hypothetical protein